MHFDPEDILVPSQQLECECTKTHHETKDLCSFMYLYQDKTRIKHSTKKIQDTLETLTFKLENDGMYGSKCCFSPPLSTLFYSRQESIYTVCAK